MNKMGFYDFMRAGHVKRWHIVNTTREQTLAEHLYLVLLVSIQLYNKVVGIDFSSGSVGPDDRYCELMKLVFGAMFHDSAEIRQGDTPTPAKEFIKSMAGEGIFSQMEEHLLPEIPYIGGRLAPALRQIVDMADRIEAAHFIHENKAGIHADMVAKGCWKKMVTTAVEYGWVSEVNEILQSLGMPYIYAEAMESAP